MPRQAEIGSTAPPAATMSIDEKSWKMFYTNCSDADYAEAVIFASRGMITLGGDFR
jgi:hypothetical protein